MVTTHSSDSNREVTVRLNAMIALTIEDLRGKGQISKARAIEILYVSGLTPTEIGEILEIPATSVGSVMSKLKSQKSSRSKARRRT
jgi:hypothetical protein